MLGAGSEFSLGECVRHANSLLTLTGTCFSGHTVTYNLFDHARRTFGGVLSVHTSADQSQTDTIGFCGGGYGHAGGQFRDFVW
jgi:hypothetical protein